MSETSTEVTYAEVPGATKDDLVVIALAHPLTRKDRETMGLPVDAVTEVDSKIGVRRDHAQALIGGGYAQVDPEDRAAVKAVLAKSAASTAPADGSGDADDTTADDTGSKADSASGEPADDPGVDASDSVSVDPAADETAAVVDAPPAKTSRSKRP